MRITITLDRDEDFYLIKHALRIFEAMPQESCAFRWMDDEDTIVFMDRTKAGWSMRIRYQPILKVENKDE